MLKDQKAGYTYYIEILGLLLVIAMVIFWGPSTFTYDEPYYLSDIPLLKEYGIGKTYLENLFGPAGPTHPVLHYLLLPVTKLKVLPVRMVNIFLFVFCVLLLNRVFKQLKLQQISLVGICIPMSMVAIGMALTEMPAIFCMCVGIYFFTKKPTSGLYDSIYKLISGIFVSFAILGRQPMLLVIPFFIYLNGISRERMAGNIIFLIASLALPLYCFSIWGGIIPSKWNAEVNGAESIVIVHFILALGYTLLTLLIIAPGFLRLPIKINPFIIIISIGILFAISIFAKLQFSMLNTLAAKVLPSKLLQYYPNLCFAILLAAALFLVIVFAYRLYENRSNKLFVFAVLSCGAILSTTLAIKHQFSSRYVFQAFPFMIIMAEPYIKFTLSNNMLRALGLLLGLASLFTYFS